MAEDRIVAWLLEAGATTDGELACLYSEEELRAGRHREHLRRDLGLADGDIEEYEGVFSGLLAKAKLRHAVQTRLTAGLPSWELAARAVRRRARETWEEEEARYRRARAETRREEPPAQPPRVAVASATRRQRAMDGDPLGRTRGEEAERRRWLGELIELVKSSGIALLNEDWDGVERGNMMTILAGGRRASTLRTRARAWKAFQRYMSSTSGRLHPRSAADALDYLQSRAAEPCSKAVIKHLKSLFTFLDQVTNSSPPLMTDRLLAAAFKETLSRAPARREGDAVQAARYPVKVVALMEMFVADECQDAYLRILAWWTLLGAWSTMRFDDHRGLPNDAFRRADGGTTFDLVRSKTTGPDKGAQLRPGFICDEAYIEVEGWFNIGLALCTVAMPFTRDYWLCVPSSDLSGAIHREVSYDEFSARLRGVLARLQADGEPLGVAFASTFTPHSGRNFLPSAAVALGAGEEEVRKLGAWSVKGGGAYIRTVRAHVERTQTIVARAIRSAKGGRDAVRDQEALEVLGRHLGARGVSREARDRTVTALTWSPAGPGDRATNLLASTTFGSAANTSNPPVGGSAVVSDFPNAAAESEEISGYVTSVTGRRGIRRLHYVGLCHRRPGQDYARYECHGSDMPHSSEYDAVCRQCWPDKAAGAQVRAAEDGSSVASSDESSSTESEC